MHLAIAHDNKAVFDLLLQAGASAEVKSSEGFPPLWEALRRQEKDEESDFARRLVQEGKAAVSVVRESRGRGWEGRAPLLLKGSGERKKGEEGDPGVPTYTTIPT